MKEGNSLRIRFNSLLGYPSPITYSRTIKILRKHHSNFFIQFFVLGTNVGKFYNIEIALCLINNYLKLKTHLRVTSGPKNTVITV